jgi:hypothetical protein
VVDTLWSPLIAEAEPLWEGKCFTLPRRRCKVDLTPLTKLWIRGFCGAIAPRPHLASQQVEAKYGHRCSLALGQLKQIETKVLEFQDWPYTQVKVL